MYVRIFDNNSILQIFNKSWPFDMAEYRIAEEFLIYFQC